jgi:hypothetical protein
LDESTMDELLSYAMETASFEYYIEEVEEDD